MANTSQRRRSDEFIQLSGWDQPRTYPTRILQAGSDAPEGDRLKRCPKEADCGIRVRADNSCIVARTSGVTLLPSCTFSYGLALPGLGQFGHFATSSDLVAIDALPAQRSPALQPAINSHHT